MNEEEKTEKFESSVYLHDHDEILFQILHPLFHIQWNCNELH